MLPARDTRGGIVLLDGATGTELERRGVDISLPLWSARALLTARPALAEVHASYLQAGADAITANTFRTHRRSLAREGLGDRAAELTRAAVDVACEARDRHRPDAIVLGSVAPLEDCYRPDLVPGESACRREHAELIGNLVGAGVDGVLLETMGSRAEARAAIAAARQLAPDRWMASFCVRADGPPGILLDGEPLATLAAELEDAVAVLVNCVAAPRTARQVEHLRALLPAARIGAYANVGHADAAGAWVPTDATTPAAYAGYAASWVRAGASIVGGCCGTTPDTLVAVAERLRG